MAAAPSSPLEAQPPLPLDEPPPWARQPLGKVIAHVDLDAFYCAVERERDSRLSGRPLVVVQYNPRGTVQELSAESDRRLLEPAADNGCAARTGLSLLLCSCS